MKKIETFKGKSITFYSYKGGVGRSMALINIACLLAKQGKKVLMIDWDLEAPGLHTYFNGDVKKTDLGLVDLIIDSKEYLDIEKNNNEDRINKYFKDNIGRFIKSDLVLKEQKKLKLKHRFTLDLLKAGNFDKEYTSRLSSINWIDFYSHSPEYFRTFAKHLEEKYDYILIDSRTGLADSSGVCTMLMPSVLVLVFALNQQNIDGVITVCRQSLEYRFSSHDERNLNIFPLPARIDGNSKNYQHWEDIYKKEFETLFSEIFKLERCDLRNYFDIAQIKYDSSNSYGENIPTLTENVNNRKFISYDYNQLANIIDREIPIWEYLSIEEISELYNKAEKFKIQKNFKEAVKCLEKLLPYKDDYFYYNFLSSTMIEYSKEILDKTSKKFILGKSYEYALLEYKKSNNSYNLACVLSLLNKKDEAFSYLEKVLQENKENINEYYNLVIKIDLNYDFINIKDDPKFEALMRKYNVDLSENKS